MGTSAPADAVNSNAAAAADVEMDSGARHTEGEPAAPAAAEVETGDVPTISLAEMLDDLHLSDEPSAEGETADCAADARLVSSAPPADEADAATEEPASSPMDASIGAQKAISAPSRGGGARARRNKRKHREDSN